jgi:hypothetical protein
MRTCSNCCQTAVVTSQTSHTSHLLTLRFCIRRGPLATSNRWPGAPVCSGRALTTCFAQEPREPRKDENLIRIENRELLVGDVVAISEYSGGKQVGAGMRASSLLTC